MKLTMKFLLLLFAWLIVTSPYAQAHDMWATADQPQAGRPLTAIIGYGHNFPKWEEIDKEEVGLFKPVRVIGPKAELTMKPGSPNYAWVSAESPAPGDYLVVVDVNPVFWTKTPSGWAMKPKNEAEGGLECGHYIENAKGIVKVGAGGGEAGLQTVGLPLEMTPQMKPSSVKVGQRLPIKVLFQGKPLAGAKVEGRFAGLADLASPQALAFSDIADQEGQVNFVPLKAGDWLLTVRNVKPFAESGRCDKEDYGTSLYFHIDD